MKNLLIAAIVGVFLFAGSSAISWYLMTQQEIANKDDEVTLDENVEDDPISVPILDEVEKKDEMLGGLQPDVPVSHKSVLELAKTLRIKEQEVSDRKRMLAEEKVGLEAMKNELAIERKSLDSMADKVDSKIARLTELLATLKVENDKLEERKTEIAANGNADAVPGPNKKVQERVKNVMEIFGTLPDKFAANMLKEYVNKGDLDFVGALIKKLEARKAAKILGALEDPALAQQIFDLAN